MGEPVPLMSGGGEGVCDRWEGSGGQFGPRGHRGLRWSNRGGGSQRYIQMNAHIMIVTLLLSQYLHCHMNLCDGYMTTAWPWHFSQSISQHIYHQLSYDSHMTHYCHDSHVKWTGFTVTWLLHDFGTLSLNSHMTHTFDAHPFVLRFIGGRSIIREVSGNSTQTYSILATPHRLDSHFCISHCIFDFTLCIPPSY